MEDILSTESVTRNLSTRFLGQNTIYLPKVTSTMEIARKLAIERATEGTAVIADEQTDGKGRLKRAWISPQGSLSLSVVLYPHLAHLTTLIMVASVAVVQSIEKTTGLRADIKWPNDVLLNDKKICGILIENSFRNSGIGFSLIGIGLNVNVDIAKYPEIASLSTSLSLELGKDVSRLQVLRRLLMEIEDLYMLLDDGDKVYRRWKDRLVTLGKSVRVTNGGTAYEGIAESVEPDGSLILRQPDGKIIRILAGDVTLRT